MSGESEITELPHVLLVGNPNAGKTSLFNALTGLRAQTANYPGITVDLRKSKLRLKQDAASQVEVIDLPGMYSLEPASPEEDVAAQCLNGQVDHAQPNAVVVVADPGLISKAREMSDRAARPWDLTYSSTCCRNGTGASLAPVSRGPHPCGSDN